MVSLLAALSATAILLETARFSHGPLNRTLVRWLKPLLKEGEEQKVTGATYMIIAGLGCFFFFDQGVAVAALLFLSVGDPVAALVGQRAPGPRLRGKSFLGSLALLLATVALSLILWQAGVASPLWVLLAGGCVASAVELIPLPLDDNATIPLISGGAMALLGA
jgi:dolichol kinase